MTIGFRFRPSDREIINDYLIRRMDGHDFSYVICDIDLCRHEPWDLPGVSVVEDEEVWYFFCRPEYKYRNSKRANRATGSGFWKPTGKVRHVRGRGGAVIGTKRTLVFYAKTGSGSVSVRRTTWVIHEYQVLNVLPGQREFVFCKLKDKSDEQTDSSAVEEAEQDIRVGFEAGCDTPSASIILGDIARIQQGLYASGSEFDLNGVLAMGRKAVESSEDEVDPFFADSFLTEPEESVEDIHLPPSEDVLQDEGLRMNDQYASARQFRQAASVQTVYKSLPPSSLDVNQSGVKIPNTFTPLSCRAVKIRHEPEKPKVLESSELSASYPQYQTVSSTRQSGRQGFLESAKVSPTRQSDRQRLFGSSKVSPIRQSDRQTLFGSAKVSPTRQSDRQTLLESNESIKQDKGYKHSNHLDAKKAFQVGEKTSISNTNTSSSTRRNTVPSHQPTPPPIVHIVNVAVGLVLLWALSAYYGLCPGF